MDFTCTNNDLLKLILPGTTDKSTGKKQFPRPEIDFDGLKMLMYSQLGQYPLTDSIEEFSTWISTTWFKRYQRFITSLTHTGQRKTQQIEAWKSKFVDEPIPIPIIKKLNDVVQLTLF